MARRQAADAEDWDHGDDPDEEPTLSCPYCGKQIHEESQRCSHCETYLSAEDVPPTRKPWWLVLGVLLALYAVYRWIVA